VIQFKTASKAQAKLRCALFGPSGSGKTYSALRIATGLGGKIALVDTERYSASKYADRFDFDVCDLVDRSIDGYVQAFQAAAQAGYDVLIIDSLSHAWHELLQEVERLARARFAGNSWAAWSEGTPKQRRLIDTLLDYPGHVIGTIRTKTAWDQAKDEKTGKSRPVRVGLVPEQGKGIEYEFDLLLQIDTDHVASVLKDRTGKYQDKLIEKPGEDFGKELSEWLAEGVPAKPAAAGDPKLPAIDYAMKDLGSTLAPTGVGPDLARLNQLIAECGLTETQQAKWCTYFKVDRIDQLKQKQIDAIVAKIESTLTPQ